MKTGILITNTFDPWWNLAVEEYLLEQVQPNECILYLWQNQNTVVIGKNQNPWKECRVDLIEKEGGKLARRISGGGAVFHDLGNLNFSFLVDREKYSIPAQLEVILSAVRRLGIDARFSGRNDLTIGDKKFSGNAFCYRKQAALHHGTILVSVDREKMTRYLQVAKEKIQSKGIESIRSRVVNLKELQPNITIEDVKESIVDSFKQYYGSNTRTLSMNNIDRRKVEELYRKYASWEWRYGETPRFNISISTRFGWGGIEIGFVVNNGIVNKAVVYSDAMDEAFIDMLPEAMEGCAFNSRDIAKSLYDLNVNEGSRAHMLDEIAQWLIEKGF